MTEIGATATGRTLVRAGLVVTGAYLASRVLGWVRTAVLLAVFGAGRDLDAYLAAFRIPDAIFQLVAAGALGSALIPVLAGLFHEGRHREAWRLVSSVTNLMLIALAVLSIVFFLLAPWIMPLITQDFTAPQMALAVRLSRIMLLSPILLAVSAVATSALNAANRQTRLRCLTSWKAPDISPLIGLTASLRQALQSSIFSTPKPTQSRSSRQPSHATRYGSSQRSSKRATGTGRES